MAANEQVSAGAFSETRGAAMPKIPRIGGRAGSATCFVVFGNQMQDILPGLCTTNDTSATITWFA